MVALPIWNIQIQAAKPIREYPQENDTSLGASLKRRRLDLGWTQQEAGDYFNKLQQNYRSYECNYSTPDVKK